MTFSSHRHAGPRRAPARDSGFTLIEILLALAVFAIGFAMVATVPSGALVLERRYEQIVEGEIAANNTGEIIAGRRAFWPMYELAYACVLTQVNLGAYHPQMGTSALDRNFYNENGAYWAPAVSADSSAGGQLTPLVCFPYAPAGNANDVNSQDNNPNDADNQGDLEDFTCHPLSNLPWGWQYGTHAGINFQREPAYFNRVFNTRNASNNWPWFWNPGTSNTMMYSGYAEDYTHLAKGRMHFCHNRLMPGNLYPLELRSYPTQIPLDQRRVFLTPSYVDLNLSCSNRQWLLHVVAQSKTPGDAWVEGDQANVKNYSYGNDNSAPPSPRTEGDLGSGNPMLANPYGLLDAAIQTAADVPPLDGNDWFNHGFITAYNSMNRVKWYGGVGPMAGSGTDATQYPSLMRLPAIIYDWDKNLIQVAYPREYVPGVANTGLGGAAGSDRRLKVGDHFLSREGGQQFVVVSTQDETRPLYATADRPYYQIVEVSPPLKSTPLGGAATNDPLVGNAGNGGNAYPYWRLCHIYIAPPATGATATSWAWDTTLSGKKFLSSNPNQ